MGDSAQVTAVELLQRVAERIRAGALSAEHR
jgi:hypothetical protein